MKIFMFLGALLNLTTPIENAGVVKRARFTANANKSGASFADFDGDGLLGIENAYVVNAWRTIVIKFAEKFGILNELVAAAKAIGATTITPQMLSNAIAATTGTTRAAIELWCQGGTDLKAQPAHGGAFLTALRPVPSTDAAATIRNTFASKGILGTPQGVADLATAFIGRGTETGDGKVRAMLTSLGITQPVQSLTIKTVQITGIDTSTATDLGAFVAPVVADPFAALLAATPVPTYHPLAIADPNGVVTSAEIATFFTANGAKTAAEKIALLKAKGVAIADGANAAAVAAAVTAAAATLATA